MVSDLALRMIRYSTRPEWLAARGNGVGGSDVAAILELSPWSAPLALWTRKVGLVEDEELKSDPVVWGSKVESAIIADVAEQAGVTATPTPLTIIRHADEPGLFCSPDALIDGGFGPPVAGLEVKNVHGGKAEEWAEGAPPYVACQAQHSMHVTGLPRWLVGACIGGRRPVWTWITRDPAWWEENGPRILDFLRRVREEDPPAPTGHDADKDALGELYPSELDGKIVPLPSDAVDLASELREIDATLKVVNKRREEIRNQFRSWLGDAEEGLIPGGQRVTWRTVTKQAHMVEATSYRDLRVLRAKERR